MTIYLLLQVLSVRSKGHHRVDRDTKDGWVLDGGYSGAVDFYIQGFAHLVSPGGEQRCRRFGGRDKQALSLNHWFRVST